MYLNLASRPGRLVPTCQAGYMSRCIAHWTFRITYYYVSHFSLPSSSSLYNNCLAFSRSLYPAILPEFPSMSIQAAHNCS